MPLLDLSRSHSLIVAPPGRKKRLLKAPTCFRNLIRSSILCLSLPVSCSSVHLSGAAQGLAKNGRQNGPPTGSAWSRAKTARTSGARGLGAHRSVPARGLRELPA